MASTLTDGPLGLFGPVSEDLESLESTLRRSIQLDGGLAAAAMGDLFDAGGKRLRPALVLLSGKVGDYDLELLTPAAVALEFTHAATLIHDDVIDGSITRRGRPTVVEAHGPAAAILVADYYFAKAYEEASITGSAEVVGLLAGAVMTICQGELAQQVARYRYRVRLDDYMRRIEMKTAALLAASCHIGAILGGVEEPVQQALTLYGLELGLAFQIVDDVLDYSGSDAAIGKPAGQDLLEGHATLPLLLALEDTEVGPELEGILEEGVAPAPEVAQRAIELVRQARAPVRALERAQEFAIAAKLRLETVPSGPAVAALSGLADYVVARTV